MKKASQASHGLEWRKVRSETGPDLGLLRVRHDWMQPPDAGPTRRRLVLESPDWVNCIATTEDGRIVLVEQHRFGIGSCTLEPPGGTVEPGESPFEAMQRELVEETGYGGGEWSYLGAVEPNPALHPHLCHHYLATGVRPISAPRPADDEVMAVLLATPDEVRAAVQDGQIRHALALTALMRVMTLYPTVG